MYCCYTAYCVGRNEEALVETKEAAIAWLQARQDKNHLSDPRNVRFSNTGLDVLGGGSIVADLTACGCVASDGYAVPVDEGLMDAARQYVRCCRAGETEAAQSCAEGFDEQEFKKILELI